MENNAPNLNSYSSYDKSFQLVKWFCLIVVLGSLATTIYFNYNYNQNLKELLGSSLVINEFI